VWAKGGGKRGRTGNKRTEVNGGEGDNTKGWDGWAVWEKKPSEGMTGTGRMFCGGHQVR